MDVHVEELAAEIKEQNRLHEAGETDRAFWLGQQRRLRTMKEADPKLTQATIGEMVGKGQHWVARVLKWDAHTNGLPFARSAAQGEPARAERAVKKALAERPTEVAGEIAKAITDPDVAEAVIENMSRAEVAALESILSARMIAAISPSIKRPPRPRKDLSRYAHDGAVAWYSAAEMLVNEGHDVPQGQQLEGLMMSVTATRRFVDAVDRVLDNEVTVEQFAAELEDLNTVREMLG